MSASSGQPPPFGQPLRAPEFASRRRVDAIAARHAAEYAVSLLDGAYTAGADHAPLPYAVDPRQDVPSALQEHLRTVLADVDPVIVRSWLTAIFGDVEVPKG